MAQTNTGWTVLHHFVENLNDDKGYTNEKHRQRFQQANMTIIRLLLEDDEGSDVNSQTQDGKTVLHFIAMNSKMNRIDIGRILTVFLEHGADPTIQEKSGMFPLDSFKDPKLFDPTTVFLLIRSMVAAGF